MPQPRLIDPAVFYDVVKIRRAVDEATEDAVRASNGLNTNAMNHMGRLDPFGGGGGTGPKMSKERIFKIRQKAVKLLTKAYTLDEVAASVATMQSTSSLEEVASHVQKRDKADTDAKYVHFFHEKIPSRMMEHYTPLEPLTEIIMSLPWDMQGAPLRTRALVQIFKGEYEGAASDLSLGLRIAQELKVRHKPGADQLVLAKHFRQEQEHWDRSGKDWRQVPQLREDDQPSSLEQQMLFNRAGVYLTIACQHIHLALDGLKDYQQKTGLQDSDVQEATPEEKQAHQVRLEARKKVKTYAKRALKDYLSFLEHFDYTPGLPLEITNEIMRRVYDLANDDQMTSGRGTAETAEQKRERRKQEAILDALADERVVDEETFQRAVRARERRAIEDEEGHSGPLNDSVQGKGGVAKPEQVTNGQSNGSSHQSVPPKRWAQDEGKEYPISTERAEAIARWIREAPLSMGGVKKKRPAKKKSKPSAPEGYAVSGTIDGIEAININDEREEEEVD
ncbi:hypothetical protein MBLNU459_g6901t2 [Dothideomycetes sp. NU459]